MDYPAVDVSKDFPKFKDVCSTLLEIGDKHNTLEYLYSENFMKSHENDNFALNKLKQNLFN